MHAREEFCTIVYTNLLYASSLHLQTGTEILPHCRRWLLFPPKNRTRGCLTDKGKRTVFVLLYGPESTYVLTARYCSAIYIVIVPEKSVFACIGSSTEKAAHELSVSVKYAEVYGTRCRKVDLNKGCSNAEMHSQGVYGVMPVCWILANWGYCRHRRDCDIVQVLQEVQAEIILIADFIWACFKHESVVYS
jgi:hypothetical protein